MPVLATTLWIANVLLNTAGQLAFKSIAVTRRDDEMQRWRIMLASPRLWAGIVCFSLEFFAWFALLSLIPLSQAMLIASINIVAVIIGGRLFFGDRLGVPRVAGMLLIAIGVALAGGSA